MVAVTATFVVLRLEAQGSVRAMTVLTGLTDRRPYSAVDPALPTYDEAVRIATDRGLARQPRIGFLKHFGVAEYVPVSERVVLNSSDELEALAATVA